MFLLLVFELPVFSLWSLPAELPVFVLSLPTELSVFVLLVYQLSYLCSSLLVSTNSELPV